MYGHRVYLLKRVRLCYAAALPVYHMQINRPYSPSRIHVLLAVVVVLTFSYYIISGIWVGFASAAAAAAALALALLLMAVALAVSA